MHVFTASLFPPLTQKLRNPNIVQLHEVVVCAGHFELCVRRELGNVVVADTVSLLHYHQQCNTTH